MYFGHSLRSFTSFMENFQRLVGKSKYVLLKKLNLKNSFQVRLQLQSK